MAYSSFLVDSRFSNNFIYRSHANDFMFLFVCYIPICVRNFAKNYYFDLVVLSVDLMAYFETPELYPTSKSGSCTVLSVMDKMFVVEVKS